MKKDDLIPRQDGKFNDFQNLLIATITANAGAWNIPSGQVTQGTTLQSVWVPAYALVTDPATKTTPKVEAKNIAKRKFQVWMRPFLQKFIMLNEAVSDADRVALGLKPHDKTRTRVAVPATTVQLDVFAGHGNSVKVLFRQEADSDDKTSRGKPDGVSQCEIAFKVDLPVPVSADQCTNWKVATRSPLVIGFTPEQAGKRLYVFARWLNTRDEAGPWTPVPVSIIIPG